MINTNSTTEFWDGFASGYSEHELSYLQGNITCFTLTNCTRPNMIILEVGCATGVASEMAAKSLLNDGSVLVSCDFSGEMCKLFNERLQKSDFTLVSGNSFEMDAEINHVSSENSKIDLQKIRKGNKVVFGC